jgi:hypothetical protein
MRSLTHWKLSDVAYEDILRRPWLKAEPRLLYLLASASFVEITSDLYASALIDFFQGDREVTDWLNEEWLPEELQHGVALTRYVNTVWPEFDWDSTYQSFYREYSQRCRIKVLGPTWVLEMASRCVVETGTASLYTMLQRAVSEPVLRQLTWFIRNDEIGHYKHFYRYFSRFREQTPAGRYVLARALWSRISEIDQEDGYCAFKHVFTACHPERDFNDEDYLRFCDHYKALARQYYPYTMAAKMFLKPLGLSPLASQVVVPLMSVGAKCLCGWGSNQRRRLAVGG